MEKQSVQFGFHNSIKDIRDTLLLDKSIGASIVQIFSRSPQNGRQISTFHGIAAIDDNFKVYTHAPYYINMITNPALAAKQIIRELEYLDGMKNGVATVVHAGSNVDDYPSEKVLANIVESVRKIAEAGKWKSRILIENRAKAGKLFPVEDIEMCGIYRALLDAEVDDITGFCYDTCHGYVTNYITKVKDPIEKTLSELIGTNIPIELVHLNDTANHTRDVHELPGKGLIPNFGNIITLCKKHDLPMLVEDDSASFQNKETIAKLITKC